MSVRNFIETGLLTAAGGATLLGCAATPPPLSTLSTPEAYVSDDGTDQRRQIQDIEACYRQLAPLAGIDPNRATTIISRSLMEAQKGVGGTFQINRADNATLDFTVKSVKQFSKAALCHEVWHVIQSIRSQNKQPHPPLSTTAYLETEAQLSAAMVVPEFTQDITHLKNVGENMVATEKAAIPDFFRFKPGIKFTQQENDDFQIGTQIMFYYYLGPLNYFDYLQYAFKDVKTGYAQIQQQLMQQPENAVEIFRQAAGYASDEEFYQSHPFFGPMAAGPRVFTYYDDAGYLYVYYFTVLTDGSIQPLEGIATYKTMDGKFRSNMKVKGIGHVKLNDAFQTPLQVRIDSEGVPGSLTDHITIPK